MRMAAEGGCTEISDRCEPPLRQTADSGNHLGGYNLVSQCKSIGDAMGPKAGVDLHFAYSVVSEFLGGRRTIWVRVRNCLHTCNRTQVRPATNEETDGLEMISNWIQELSEDVRRGRLQHYAGIIAN